MSVRVLVDIDSTIADWGKAYDDALDKMDTKDGGRCTHEIPRTKDQVAFNLKKGLSDFDAVTVDMIMDAPGFYRTLPEIPGAIDALVEIQAADEYDIFLVTSPWHTNPTCSQDKLDWVREHLGEAWVDKVIITKDKTLIDGDYLIDDKPSITGAVENPKWQHIVFDQPYNQHITDKERLTYWAEALDHLDTLESEKNIAKMTKAFKDSKTKGGYKALNPNDVLQGVSMMVEPGEYVFKAGASTIQPSEVRSVSSTGGEKGQKPQAYDLIPVYPMDLLAELYHNGSLKYSSHNWRKGYSWSNSYAAAMRHMTTFWNGEDNDPEMGLPHVISAAFHMFALAQFMHDFPEFDDRFKS